MRLGMAMFMLGGGGLCEGIFFLGIAIFMGGGGVSDGGLRLGILHESKLLPLLLPSMVLMINDEKGFWTAVNE